MADFFDITNTKFLEKALENKEVKELFKKIEELLSVTNVKKVTINPKVYNEIFKLLPINYRPDALSGMQYKTVALVPLIND